jgi:hypothetical protein
MIAVAVEEGGVELAAERLADDGFAARRDAHDDDDTGRGQGPVRPWL